MSSFVDQAQIHIKAGNGGAGAVSFRREAHVPRGGPDGGNGGRGGDVSLEASTDAVSLLAFRDHPHRRATDGTHGGSGRRQGRGGVDLVVAVPVGTVVRELDGSVVADLASPGDRLLAARAGRGGRGNASFQTNRLRAPGFAEQGEVGEERWLDLELKLVADVAIVGMPNAGKSTLISVISAAKPKIADYPFTTLEPHLGVVRLDGAEGAEYVVADIPGLVEGASTGRGLGIEFLRHIERARVLLVLVDLLGDAGRSPTEQVTTLLHELGSYRPELLERPRLVAGSRADGLSEAERPPLASYGGDLVISAATREGIPSLVRSLAGIVERARQADPQPMTEPVVHRLEGEGLRVEAVGGEFVVHGRDARRAVALSDLTNADALAEVAQRLRRLDLDRALRRAGCREGDTVRIGELTFAFEEDT